MYQGDLLQYWWNTRYENYIKKERGTGNSSNKCLEQYSLALDNVSGTVLFWLQEKRTAETWL